MQNIQHIPFNNLAIWAGNVRRTGIGDGIESLAASIDAHGLLQPIVVRNNIHGKFPVIAGRRRFLALQNLVENGKFAEDAPVACTIVDDTSDDTEISLVENAMQLPMHPADKFEAFRELADKGMSASDISVRFGVAESMVIRLMKLGRVSPEVMTAYREGQIEYAQVQAFTISDDVEAQNRILESILTTYQRLAPHAIRRELVKDEIPATAKRVLFVGLEFYELCGGTVRRDLFDDQNSGYIQDMALLNQLVDNKLQSTMDELKTEGWKWVEATLEQDWQYRSRFRRIAAHERELPPEEAQKLEPLIAEYDACQEQEYDDDGNDNPEVTAHIQELEEQIKAIQNSAKEWLEEDKAIAGALVSLDSDGELDIERGLLKREDARQSGSDGNSDDESPFDNGARPEKVKPEFSAALLKDLTSHRTAALRIALANQPDIALVAVVHALGGRIFYQMSGGNCVKLSGEQRYLFPSDGPVTALTALENKRKGFSLPEQSRFWDWCLKRSQEELLELLAVCAAYSVDAVQDKGCHNSKADIVRADNLASALNLDMRKWFASTADTIFSRISKKQILAAYTEVTNEPPSNAVLDLKKKELAIRAEREIGDKWLPSVLRQQQASPVQEGTDDE